MGWRPDPAPLAGPVAAAVGDIDALNRVFSDAFTDRYRRDGLSGMRVPFLNPMIWRYAIEDGGNGALIWRDEAGKIAAFNMVHRSGSEGWMGPLAVRPDRQGRGEGRRVVQAGIDWLRSQGVATLGLETMPRTVENIGFYSALGFRPGRLTVTLLKELGRRPPEPLLLSRTGGRRAELLAACRALSVSLIPGVDFTREIELTERLALGDTVIIEGDGGVLGFALCHCAPLADGRSSEELRVLKLVARDLEAFDRLLLATQWLAHKAGLGLVGVRCQTGFDEPYARLIGDGWRVHWTDLRMTLAGYPERGTAGGVVWSNWEI
ncbi:MAG: GNAT family N-acetyltransferase, partial [Gemmatimonadales bacterium]